MFYKHIFFLKYKNMLFSLLSENLTWKAFFYYNNFVLKQLLQIKKLCFIMLISYLWTLNIYIILFISELGFKDSAKFGVFYSLQTILDTLDDKKVSIDINLKMFFLV